MDREERLCRRRELYRLRRAEETAKYLLPVTHSNLGELVDNPRDNQYFCGEVPSFYHPSVVHKLTEFKKNIAYAPLNNL